MKKHLATTIATAVCLLAPLAHAQVIRPGLWEVSSNKMQVDGQQLPGMQEMLERMKSLPPEQRKMMEDMMAKQGVQVGDKGVRICLTAEQVKADNIPLQHQQGGCKNEFTERSAERWAFRFTCPEASGEGETRFISDREYVTRITGTHQRSGQAAQQSEMEYVSRWIGEDCGNVPPVRLQP